MLQTFIPASSKPISVQESALFENGAVTDNGPTTHLPHAWGCIPRAVACLDSRVSYRTNLMLNLG